MGSKMPEQKLKIKRQTFSILIAIYLEKSKDAAIQLYGDWFIHGRASKERFFVNLGLDMSISGIEPEFEKHEVWKAKTQLRSTLTILVNGYKLPDNYKIEDLRYFAESYC